MNAVTFNDKTFTEASLNDLSGPALVSLYNDVMLCLHDGREDRAPAVRRLADKSTAVSRTWKLLQRYGEAAAKAQAPKAKAEAVDHGPSNKLIADAIARDPELAARAKAPKKPRARKGTNLLPPGHAPVPCREASKQAMLLDLLSREGGVTMAELIDGLCGGNKPWTEATVRSGFGWDMKLKGYGVRSEFDAEGVERFFIVVPEGHAIPAHKPLKGAPKADARQRNLGA